MGHRALKTGDLIIATSSIFHPEHGWTTDGTNLYSDQEMRRVIGTFTFGMYLGGTLRDNRVGRTDSISYVFDSKTMLYGCVKRKYITRAR